MRLINWTRAPKSLRVMSKADRLHAVEILRDFAERQRNTRRTLSDKVSPESLAQIEEYRVVFETAADLMAVAADKAPEETLPSAYADAFEELDQLRRERYNALSERERADMAEKQLRGATEEIEVLKNHVRKLVPDDPLVRLLDNKPGEEP